MPQYIEDNYPNLREGIYTKAKVDFSGSSSVTLGSVNQGSQTTTSTSANALTVGANGATNPQFNVDASASSVATGLNIAGAAAGSGVTVSTLSSGTDEKLIINPKGSAGLVISTLAGNTGVQIGATSSLSTTVLTVKSSNVSAFAVGTGGVTNPALQVDSSTSAAVTGIKVKSATAAAGAAVSVISSGTNENLTIDAKGSGTITLNGTGTGAVVIGSGFSIGAVSSTGAQVLASSPTISLTVTNQLVTHTPTQSETINMAAVPQAGTEVWLVVTTSGSSSFTLTFGTSFKTTGTLATGTATGKVFVMNFVSDGTNLNEVSRTAAM